MNETIQNRIRISVTRAVQNMSENISSMNNQYLLELALNAMAEQCNTTPFNLPPDIRNAIFDYIKNNVRLTVI